MTLLATNRVLHRGKRSDWAIWVVANVASWYVYYYLALLTVAEATVLLVVAWRRGQGKLWALSEVAIVAGFLPWLVILTRWLGPTKLALPPDTAVHLTPLGYLRENWQDLTTGFTAPPGGPLLLAAWAIVAVAGGLILTRRRPVVGMLLLASIMLLTIFQLWLFRDTQPE